MKTRKLKYGELRQVLIGLGFCEQTTKSNHLVYRHPDSHLPIFLPRMRATAVVEPIEISEPSQRPRKRRVLGEPCASDWNRKSIPGYPCAANACGDQKWQTRQRAGSVSDPRLGEGNTDAISLSMLPRLNKVSRTLL